MIIQLSIFAVIKRLPDHEESIKRLYKKSELFRDLCESCQKCAEALKHWNASQLKKAPARRKEYATLLKEIEADIVREINKEKLLGLHKNKFRAPRHPHSGTH